MLKRMLCAVAVLSGMCGAATSDEPRVAASIGPVHSLVANVMNGVGEPGLIVRGSGSPHAYALRPAEADLIENADLVFMVGPGLEQFLADILPELARNALVVNLIETPGLALLDLREGGSFGTGDHGDDDHDEEGDQEHEEHAGPDTHIWLDPDNAALLVRKIARALSELDPENAENYAANADTTVVALRQLSAEIEEVLAPVAGENFVVFHDGYHYFERRFDVAAVGAVTLRPEEMPGARRISEIKELITDLDVTCVFSEPQFTPRIVETVLEGSGARSGVLDPIGAALEPGSGLYFDLLLGMAQSMRDCLADGPAS